MIARLTAMLTLAVLPAVTPTASLAQDMGRETPAIVPLVARYVEADGALAIGGGPEAGDVAAAFATLTGRDDIRLAPVASGPSGAIALLTQGTILVAILPRELTPIERLAVRRFDGGFPLSIALTKDMRAFARRDAAGTIDPRARAVLARLVSAEGQVALAARMIDQQPLSETDRAKAAALLAGTVTATPPAGAPGYRLPDGRIAIIGSDTLEVLLPALNAAFEARHPTTRFATDLRGSSTAMPALTAGTSMIAPMGRELWANDLAAFREMRGYAPTRIRIAYAGYGPRTEGKVLPAPYVNARNPVAGLNMTQFQRIFAAGAPGGDARCWGDVGLSGDWRGKPLHVYGVRDDGGFATAMRLDRLGGLPFSARYQALSTREAVMAAVAADPLGIGYVSWTAARDVLPGVRLLPMAERAGMRFVTPRAAATRGGSPLSYFVNIYVDREPGRPVPAFLRTYLSFLLSDEAQAIISRHVGEEEGNVPLNAHDLAEERAKVAAL